jgi:branched-chain amino acid transport system ATP-binding protein
MTQLDIRNVSLQFGGLRVLNDISLQVAKGELLALIGPNGAGKTSVFNCISGIYRPTGAIGLNDTSLIGLRPADIAALGVARTFQHAELCPTMSIADNLLAARHLRLRTGALTEMISWPSARREEKRHRDAVRETIAFVGLERFEDAIVGDLPFGVQKLVGFARALAMEPLLLLLDEPSAGLTGDERSDMARFIVKTRRKLGIAAIWIEHDMQMVADLADKVLVLDYGRTLAYGRPDDVLGDPEVVKAYLGIET